MSTFYVIRGWLSNPLGSALPGQSVAILTQPAVTTTQPGSPLATLYAASSSNSATISSASWSAQQITFVFSTTPPSDVVAGAYIAVSGASPSGYNSTVSAPWLVVSVSGDNVVVTSVTDPGTYVSGGTVATSAYPNPITTDGNGYWSGYAAAGTYTIQMYGGSLESQLVYADWPCGTVAGGSVTSVALTLPSQFSVSGSPVTSSGTLAGSWTNESANAVLAGPSSGSAAAPTFRALVTADMPSGTGTVTSVAHTLTVPGIFSSSVTGSPVTTTGTIADTISLATQSANLSFAGPASGSAATPTFRSLVGADLPFWNAVTTLTGSTDALAFPSVNYITTAGVDATTLATPTAGTDDGKMVRVVDAGGHAHTITTAANKIVPSHHLITFGGTAGSFVDLQSFNGLWYVLASSGVTPS